MFQPDLFAVAATARSTAVEERPILDLPGVLDRLTSVCARPRYNFMVLNLIAQVSAETGCAGPYIQVGERRILVRDWLSDALTPVAKRHPRRLGIAGCQSAL